MHYLTARYVEGFLFKIKYEKICKTALENNKMLS